ncbi:tyrosine-type recombinase/integrase [Aquimarina muelleri]|uniref:tyrosine-type recombinase/integrase n=1 Tax=Aquimarina muelleri TaxID=279356 RepID=UPI003F685B98
MAKLSYKLRSLKGKGASIQLNFNYGTNNRLRYSTGLKIRNIKNWDENKMRIKNVLEEVDKVVINNKLNDLQSKFLKMYSEVTVNQGKAIDNNILKEFCDEYFNKTSKVKSDDEYKELLPFFEWYMDYHRTNPSMTTGKPIASGTLKTYKNTYKILKRFNRKVYKLTYEKITLEFYENFLDYLREEDYATTYIGTIIKILKTIMGAAFERGYHNNLDFKKPTEEVYNIYLTPEELRRIENLKFTTTYLNNYGLKLTPAIMSQARDLFLIGANTGLRVSDYNRLEQKNLIERNGRNYIEIKTKKTGKVIAIPINSVIKEILDRNNGIPPKKMPEQHINYALKKIGELAQIKSEVNKKNTKGGKEVVKTYKKYELITNHTGRRSFCTNAYMSEMPTIDIMAISGHSSEKTFYNYIKVDHLERADKIALHKFFS